MYAMRYLKRWAGERTYRVFIVRTGDVRAGYGRFFSRVLHGCLGSAILHVLPRMVECGDQYLGYLGWNGSLNWVGES